MLVHRPVAVDGESPGLSFIAITAQHRQKGRRKASFFRLRLAPCGVPYVRCDKDIYHSSMDAGQGLRKRIAARRWKQKGCDAAYHLCLETVPAGILRQCRSIIKPAGEGGNVSRVSSDRMAARRAVPVSDEGALRASTAEMRGSPLPQNTVPLMALPKHFGLWHSIWCEISRPPDACTSPRRRGRGKSGPVFHRHHGTAQTTQEAR